VSDGRDGRVTTDVVRIMYDFVEELVVMSWDLEEHTVKKPFVCLSPTSTPSYNHFIALEFGTGGSLAYRLVPKHGGY
jgi:hypothetical protein